MPKFQYTALSKDQKTLSGIIEAENEENAHNKLNSLQLSVVALDQIPEGVVGKTKSFNKYKFEAVDKNGKMVLGTIAGDTLLNALARLTNEYDIKVNKLSAANSTQEELDSSKTKVEEMYQKLNKLDISKKSDNTIIDYEKEKNQESFVKIIDEVIATLRNIQAQFSIELKPEALVFLQKYEQHLSKIKHSENLENIAQAALKVLKHLQDTKLFIDENQKVEEKLQMLLVLLKLESILKVKSITKSSVSVKISHFLSKLGFKTDQDIQNKKSKLREHFTEIKHYIKILLTTKSKNLRSLAFKNIFESIYGFFKNKNKIQSLQSNSDEFKQSNTENILFVLSAWLCGIYLTYYFVSIFATEKIIKDQNISKLFYVFNTRFIIYFIIGIIFTHSAIKIKSLMDEHKILHGKISYTLFSLLFVMILINL